MSSTRHSHAGAALSQERYMSSPEFAELRGINGGAVAAKAATLLNPRKRSLLFFLQGMSLRPGGLNQFVKDFLALFSDRLGSPAMHRSGIKPGKVYSQTVVDQVINDLFLVDIDELLDSPEGSWGERNRNKWRRDPKADRFLEICRTRALQDLPDFITEICINPRLNFSAEGDEEWMQERERESAEQLTNVAGGRFISAAVPWFHDLIGALFEFQKRFEDNTREQFVMTTIAQEVFETLDFCLETGKPVAIVGNERIGKTTAIEAWCNLHLGEARFVSLSGLTNRTAVLRSIAKAVGLASSYTRKAMEMQARVEDFLQRSRLVLVIDEAHFLFSQSVRLYTRPELVDWVDTALYNHGVPFALCATPQFSQRLNEFEKQTGWNAGQFKGRVKRWRALQAPTTNDLMAVARKLLPEADTPTIKLIVGYALTSKRHMPAIVDTVDEARLIARKAGREKVIFTDVKSALDEYVTPSDLAKERAFSPPAKRRARDLKDRCNTPEPPLQAPFKDTQDFATGCSDAGRNTTLRPAPALAG
ncbi:MAG TPA: ATP-binding protein [Verrucomicrobiae bacterium]|nr:ATP-binding protein [Verrucomicrobiae bacterium]